MTDTDTPAAEQPGREWYRYEPREDVGEIALPGYLDAVPSILTSGTVFHVAAVHVEELDAAERFVHLDAEPKKASPNEAMTKAELAEKLGDPDLESEAKADLVELADDWDRTHPVPPSASDPVVDDPELLPYDAAIAEVDPDAGDAGTDTEGSDQ